MSKSTRWHVVDQHGDVAVSADTIDGEARRQRSTPAKVAAWLAENYVNVDAGDAPVFARPVDAEPRS